jgi:hypothetical protein
MPAHSEEKKPKKFCSLLTYIEHTNRDLYDTIHDLCANGNFSARGGKSITFLMPKPGSAFHNKIINEAYGNDPMKAISMIQSCILTQQFSDADGIPDLSKFTSSGNECENALFQTLKVNTTGSSNQQVVLENKDNSKVTIIKDNKFLPLYNNARFAVFLIESGEISIKNTPVKNNTPNTQNKSNTIKPKEKMMIKGGAPTLLSNTKYNTDKCEFIREILNYDISKRTSNNAPASFLENKTVDTFTAMAISFMTFMKNTYVNRYNELLPFLNVNPMCICTIIVHLVTDIEYKQWTDFKDNNILYEYNNYTAMLPVKNKTNIDNFLNDIKNCIGNNSKSSIYHKVIELYKKEYKDNAMNVLTHHESLLVADLYLKSVNDIDSAKSYMKIYLSHYCVGNAQPVLINKLTFEGLINQSVLCKAYEFIFSDIFIGGSSHDNRQNIDIDNTTPINMLNGIVYIDFSTSIKKIFNKKL